MTDAPTTRRGAHPPAAVLWDMDGTIVDTEPYWIETEYELVAEFGGEWSDAQAHSLVGLDLRDSARILREQGGVDLPIDDIVNRLLDGVILRVQRSVPWRPGARETLARLRAAGIPCALVTMSWSRFAHSVVKALPRGTFAVVITGDEVRRGKPHPEPYLAAAHALGVKPRDCVAIEDSPTGVRSAVAAGCRTFAIPNLVDVPEGRGYTRVLSVRDISPAALGLDGASAGHARARRHRLPWWLPGLAVLALFTGVAGGVAWWVGHDDGPPPLPHVPVSAWAPYWVLDDAVASMDANGETFHELSPFWFETHGPTEVWYSGTLSADSVAPVMAAARQTGAKVVPAVVDAMDAGGMAALLADPSRRTLHVQTLLALARDNDVDGLDIDYEKFAFADDRSTWATTSPHWISFLRELANGLHAEGRILTVAVPPIYDSDRGMESGYWVYDYAAMGDIVDRIRIMAYDYSFARSGPIAPVDWVRRAVKAAKAEVADDSKLVLGIPLYGRNWVVGTDGTCPADAPGRADPNLREVAALIAQYGAVPVFDEGTGESTFTYLRPASDGATSCTQTRVVHYVDATGARLRIDIAREERIGGVVFWALGFDTPDVWTAVTPWASPRP